MCRHVKPLCPDRGGKSIKDKKIDDLKELSEGLLERLPALK